MGMGWYVARRVAWAGVVSFVILTITFVLLDAAPDAGLSQVQFQAAQSGQSVESVTEAYQARRGLQGPLWERYLDYLTNLASGDWGWSDTRSQPVTEAILTALPFTLMYNVPSIVLSTVIGMGIGLYSAVHQYERSDYVATLGAFFGVSIPNFWFGIILLLVFSVQLNWFPVLFDAQIAINRTFSVANLRQLTLPVVVLMTSALAGNARYARAEALEYVQAEFVKTARAKGATGWRMLTRHILRPTLVPLSTLLVGDLLGLLLTSSYLVEVVFGIPGVGLLSYEAIINQDTALVLGTTLIPVFIAVVGNLLQDLAYTVLDPRISYGDR
jgi:peptide/nickel transport system permease protein